MKTVLSTTLFLFSLLICAQDTIYFKNKTVVAAKIAEIGISEIKYQRFDNLTGPHYIASKSEVFLIKYSNGVSDTLKSLVPVIAPISVKMKIADHSDHLILSGNKIIYQGQTISDRKLYAMAANHPSTETQITLKKEFRKLNEYKIKEGALAPALFVVGAGLHIGALGSAFGSNGGAGSNDRAFIASAFIAGAVLRVSGHVINIVYRNKKKSKRQDIVNIYNGTHN
jgi:hypothetical protein